MCPVMLFNFSRRSNALFHREETNPSELYDIINRMKTVEGLSASEIRDQIDDVIYQILEKDVATEEKLQNGKWLTKFIEDAKHWVTEMNDTSSSDIWNYSMARVDVLLNVVRGNQADYCMVDKNRIPPREEDDEAPLATTHARLCKELESFLVKAIKE